MEKLLVTGANGLLGSAICFKARNDYEVIELTRDKCDLTEYGSTKSLFKYFKPDDVIHTAAVVGGIGSNMNHPGKFFCKNILINSNVLECARVSGVKKLISYMSTCVFPDSAPHPLKVQDVHSGPPHTSNYAYAHAKRMLDVQTRAYREEYGCNFVTLIPANMFGPDDNWDIVNGHVIPSIIHKAFIAKKLDVPLTVWGSGKPLREFLYSYDVALASLEVLKNYDDPTPLIISPDSQISIGEVALFVAEKVGLDGIIFTPDKPDGQFSKPSDNSVFKKLFPNFRFSNFEQSLSNTIMYFKNMWNAKQFMRGVVY